MDLRGLDQQALAATGAVIDRIGPADWDRPTPCDTWRVRDIVTHLIDNHRYFVGQATGRDPDYPRLPDDGLAADFHATATEFTEVFAADDTLGHTFELRQFGRLPGAAVLGVHFGDVLVHGWDLGQALGFEHHVPDELAEPAIKIVERFPDTPQVRGPGGAFGYPTAPPPQATAYQRLLALVGRKFG